MNMQSSTAVPQPAHTVPPACANEVSIDLLSSSSPFDARSPASERSADISYFSLATPPFSTFPRTLDSSAWRGRRYYYRRLSPAADLTRELTDPAISNVSSYLSSDFDVVQLSSTPKPVKLSTRLQKKSYTRKTSSESSLSGSKMSNPGLAARLPQNTSASSSNPDLKATLHLRQLSATARAQPPTELHPAFRDEARQLADSLVPAPIDTNVQPHEQVVDRTYKPEQLERDARDLSTSPDRSAAKPVKRGLLPNIRNRARSRSRERYGGSSNPRAWIAGHNTKLTYDLQPLFKTAPVPELWDEHGDTAVFLFPKASGKGPCFKLKSSLFAASKTLTDLTVTDSINSQTNAANRSNSGDSRSSRHPSLDHTTPKELYVPLLSGSGAFSSHVGSQKGSETKHLSADDVEALVSVRNLFAFLAGQSLVATQKHSSIFWTFVKVVESLKIYGFTSPDEKSYGEVAARSFDCYVEELNLGDVRGSREKTIEALVLGERMQSSPLYNEAFVHAAGKYNEISEILQQSGPNAKFEMLSSTTKVRVERSSLDLAIRIRSVDYKLHDFDFPALWTELHHSKGERKAVSLSKWKATFIATRKHVLGFYKQVYGSWPPNAKNKKNSLETSGLNRLVLKALYRDFSLLYDLWVDRTSSTPRHDMLTSRANKPNRESRPATDQPIPRLLGRLFDGYERSSPPDLPPIPYDMPILPLSNPVIMATYHENDRSRRLSTSELDSILDQSCNRDTLVSVLQSPFPFVDSMRSFEHSQAVNSSLNDLQDLRIGMWIFTYVVLQTLPLLVEDTPDVHYKRGVEYFLCEPVRLPPPWMLSSSPSIAAVGAGRSGHGSKPSIDSVRGAPDSLEHSVDSIYQRSHCWQRAAEWDPQTPQETKEARRVSAPLRVVPPSQPEPARQRARSLLVASPAQRSDAQNEMAQSEALSLAIATMSLPMYDPSFSGDTFGDASELPGDTPTAHGPSELASLDSTPISPPSAIENVDSDSSSDHRPSLQSIDRTMSWAYGEADGPVHYPGDGPSVVVADADEEENANLQKTGDKFYLVADMNSSTATLRRADASRSRSRSRSRERSKSPAGSHSPPQVLTAFTEEPVDYLQRPPMAHANTTMTGLPTTALREQKSLPALPSIHLDDAAQAEQYTHGPTHANTLMPGASLNALGAQPGRDQRPKSSQGLSGHQKKPLTFEQILKSMHADDPSHQADAQVSQEKRGRGLLRLG